MSGAPFWQIDAFADGPFTGNPAAVILLDAWPYDGLLQQIAGETNLPATAFAVPAADGEADYEICWFSPRGEIGLCGHGTLAAGHALIERRAVVRFRTRNAGVVTVAREGERYSLSLPAIPAEPHPLPDSMAALGGSPTETVWNARGYALARYANEAAVRALAPDLPALKALGKIQHIVTAPGNTTDIVSRVFSSAGGEDAATGSAHAVLTPYWAARLGRLAFSAFQASARGGRLECRLDGERVVLGGRCVTLAEGRFSI